MGLLKLNKTLCHQKTGIKQHMNRKIKFRVWDKSRKIFIDTKDATGIRHVGENGELLMDFNGNLRIAIYPCGNGDNSADSVFDIINNQDNYIIQQYTGLKDKNNKEIYEGDIIKFPPDWFYIHSIIGEIINDGTTFYFISNKNYCNSKIKWDVQEDGYKKTEIIGNILENPHLLNKN